MLINQIETLEDNWAIETDSKKKDILWKKVMEYEQNLIEVQREIEKHNDNSLNLQYFLNNGLELVYNPLKLWELSELGDKKRFQKLLFPEGFVFDKENKVIEPLFINSMFILNPLFMGDFDKKENGFFSKKTEKPKTVAGTRIELVTSGL